MLPVKNQKQKIAVPDAPAVPDAERITNKGFLLPSQTLIVPDSDALAVVSRFRPPTPLLLPAATIPNTNAPPTPLPTLTPPPMLLLNRSVKPT